MDIVVKLAAIVSMIFAVIALLAGPFTIGKTTQFTAASYIYVLLQVVLMFILGGRALGWW